MLNPHPYRALLLGTVLIACGGSDEASTTDPEAQPTTYAQKVLGGLDRTAIERTRQDMLAVGVALTSFATDSGEFPDASSYADLKPHLTPGHIRRLPANDAWGNPFEYRRTSDSWELIAVGADGKSGTGDDIVLADNDWAKLPDNYKPLK